MAMLVITRLGNWLLYISHHLIASSGKSHEILSLHWYLWHEKWPCFPTKKPTVSPWVPRHFLRASDDFPIDELASEPMPSKSCCSSSLRRSSRESFSSISWRHTLWWTYKKLWKMAVEIVDVPIKNGDFPWQNVKVHQRVQKTIENSHFMSHDGSMVLVY